MKRYILVLFMSVLFALQAFARPGDGGYAGAFLRMGLGARAKALGDAYSAIPEGAVAGFYNPALLPHLQERQLVASYSFLTLDRNFDYIGFAMPLNPKADPDKEGNPLKAGLALGWVHAGVDNIYGTDGSGNHTMDFSNSEHAFYLSFALSPFEKFSIGINGKVLYNQIPDIEKDDGALTSTGFGIDIGAFYSPVNNLTLGLVLRDNMSKYSWNTDTVYERGTSTVNKFPKVTRAAIAYRIPQQWLLLTAELEDSDKQNPRYHYGMELSSAKIGALRFGLDDNSPTFGLGLKVKILGKTSMINYAFIISQDAPGSDHIFSWAFNI